jgi:protocatechuate 3,4-dioxygenase beta subunit
MTTQTSNFSLQTTTRRPSTKCQTRMRALRHALVALCLTAAILVRAEAGVSRWQAMPAVDVQHLQGAYRGRTVCPMCQHGYDAGLLVFLPADVSVAHTANVATTMRSDLANRGARFRAFLIFTATPTSTHLLASSGAETNWYVGVVAKSDLPTAIKDYQFPLDKKAIGFVFAQRRMLQQFDPMQWPNAVADLQYAMQFLADHYPEPTSVSAPTDHDTPQGTLWLAPSSLTNRLYKPTSTSDVDDQLLCLVDQRGKPVADALISAAEVVHADCTAAKQHKCNAPTRWAISDQKGCIVLIKKPNELELRVDQYLLPQQRIRVPSSALSLQKTSVVVLPALPVPSHSVRAIDEKLTNSSAVKPLQIVGEPCEGCELALLGMPEHAPFNAQITAKSEPGESLILEGIIRDASGKSVPGTVIYAYQTDATGRYPHASADNRHGRMRAWAQADAQGRYRFITIRPGAYPGGSDPQHIHLHVIEPNRCTYYIGDVLFADDSKLSVAKIAAERRARAGSGVVRPTRDQRGNWLARRNITLGLNVPGYQECAPKLSPQAALSALGQTQVLK